MVTSCKTPDRSPDPPPPPGPLPHVPAYICVFAHSVHYSVPRSPSRRRRRRCSSGSSGSSGSGCHYLSQADPNKV